MCGDACVTVAFVCLFGSVRAGSRWSALAMGSEAVKAEGSGGSWSCPAQDCSYSSKNKSSVTTHIRQHTGEKPFHCVCGYKTGQKGHLTKHLRNMARSEPQLHREVSASKGTEEEEGEKSKKKSKKKKKTRKKALSR